MSTHKLPHEWSKESLLNKAQRYAETMLGQNRDDWQFGLWSALTLELLARAALSSVSPVLVADNREWTNVYYALGYQPNVKQFQQKSANIIEVLNRLMMIVPDFTPELRDFCIVHLNRRNTELHSGDLTFECLGTSKWLPMSYKVAQILLKSIGEDLELVFGVEEAEVADTLIETLGQEVAREVQDAIKAHKVVWQDKSQNEREALESEAKIIASRHIGHRVSCPSCGSVALLRGKSIGATNKSIEDSIIVERQTILPSSFDCSACGLKLVGYSKLNAAGFGDTFTATARYDPAEYFEIGPDYEQAADEDYNEY